MICRRTVVCIVVLCLWTARASADNWPAWRGADGTGIANESELPTRFGPDNGVAWRVPLPGPGNSTPIVWDQYVFVTCSKDEGRTRSLFCLDRRTGKRRWEYGVPYAKEETHHQDNPFCSGSPTTDGERVYASFGSAGVLALDFNGQKVWERDLGRLNHVFGLATTPVVYKDLLIIHRGPGKPTHIVGLNKHSGDTVWKTEQTGRNEKVYGSWSTPVIYRVDGHDEFALSMPGELKGFDPLTGKELWTCAGLGSSNYPDTAVGDGLLIGVCGFRKGIMAVRMGGRGDVTRSHRLWHKAASPQRIGSGVVHEGRLYVANEPGIAECFDTKSGESLGKRRLEGKLWSSVLMAAGHLYVANTEGKIFVLEATPKMEVVAENDMGEHTKSGIAASDGQIFIRTYESLYCIGKRRL